MELPYKYILLGIRGVQLLFVFLIVILEIVQAADFASYYNSHAYYVDYYDYYYNSGGSNGGTSEYFTGSTYGKAGSVVWVFMVMLITFLGIIAYSALFFLGYVWEQRHQIYFIGFDLIFFVLWFTEVFANLYWAYKGNNQFCSVYKDGGKMVDVICGAYIASNVFGWFLLVAFALGGALSLKIHFDAKKENSGTDENMRHVQPQSNKQPINQQPLNQQPPNQQPINQQPLNQQQFSQPPNQQFNQQQFSQPPNQQFNQQFSQPPNQQFNQQQFSQPPNQQFNQPLNQQFNQQPPPNQQLIERDTNHEAVLQ